MIVELVSILAWPVALVVSVLILTGTPKKEIYDANRNKAHRKE